jgi:hypothetical protein
MISFLFGGSQMRLNRTLFANTYFLITIVRKVWRYQREVIRMRNSKKNRQHNGQKKKVQKDKQRSTNHTHKAKDQHLQLTSY